MKSKNLDMQKSILLIVAVLVAGLLIGSAFSTTGEAVRKIIGGDGGGSCTDNDQDKYYYQSNCGTLKDCNDNNPNINPTAKEICGNNQDDNCDGNNPICEANIIVRTSQIEYTAAEEIEII